MAEDIFEEFREDMRDMRRMFEEFWGLRRGRPLALFPGERLALTEPGRALLPETRRPYIDVVETDKDVITSVEMPGLNKEDIKINISADRLEIFAEKKEEEEKKGKDYIYKERRSGSFYRTVSLPAMIDTNNVKATYNNGLLEIKAPKTEITKKTIIKVD
jgi:HSP20 family protein